MTPKISRWATRLALSIADTDFNAADTLITLDFSDILVGKSKVKSLQL